MKRLLLQVLAGISLLLCTATTGLWICSYWTADAVGTDNVLAMTDVVSDKGILSAYHVEHSSDFPFTGNIHWQTGHMPAFAWMPRPTGAGTRWDFHLWGFYWQVARGGSDQTGSLYTAWLSWWEIDVPDATIVILTAITSSLAFHRAQNARYRPGHCRCCGYDLRATTDRCPECGTAMKKPLVPN